MTSASERVYSRIKHDLVEGRYRSNQRLVELDLADEFNASRTPVRQALQRLELEGFVEPSRHGWIIRDYSAEEILRIYEVRIALEAEASRLAAERSLDADLDAMRQHLDRSTEAVHGGDIASFVQAHDLFHSAIVAATRNDVLAEAVRRHRDHPYNRRVAHVYAKDELLAASESHARMLEAIGAGRGEEAGTLTRAHLEFSRTITVQRFMGVY